MKRSGSVLPRSRAVRAKLRRRCVWVCGALVVWMTMGCVNGRLRDPDAYEDIAMSRVVPYPSEDEMRKRAYEIVVVDQEAFGIDPQILVKPRAQVRRALEDIAAEAGATVIARDLQNVRGLSEEGVSPDLEAEDAADAQDIAEISDADYALATRFSTYRYTADWKPPFKFLWQSPEDVAEKPGTCAHRVDVEFDIEVIEIGNNERVIRAFELAHGADRSNKDIDPACTIAPVALDVMFENALDDALSCLELPLGTVLSPRGHVTGHRKERDGEGHVYRISLGAAQGIAPGDKIEIRREQRSISPMDEEVRLERVIATGVVTDQVQAQRAWVAVDPTKALSEILDGDVVRPLLSEGLLSSLSGPKCGQILQER